MPQCFKTHIIPELTAGEINFTGMSALKDMYFIQDVVNNEANNDSN